ncbi:ester cyclase [Candidatus Bipolaricaulota bacterium]|nr:ester cyclase [Candidatus Bipolaricaulota bacterium]
MDNNCNNKKKLYEFSNKFRSVQAKNIEKVAKDYYAKSAELYGPKPFYSLEGRRNIVNRFWKPFLNGFPDAQKNDYILFGGSYDGEEWVCETGHFVGTFENDWLDIPATGRTAWVRFGEFNRLVDGMIVETRIILDLLDLMRQAGCLFFLSSAPEVISPGPATRDGVILIERDEGETEKTLRLVEDMLYEGLASYEEKGLENMGMERYWHEDMMWYGPCGIGTTRGISDFQEYVQSFLLKAFPERNVERSNSVARFAEGNYGGLASWSSFNTSHDGDGWLGLPATGEEVNLHLMDFWRREDDLLAENWVLIDMIDLLLQINVDIFERLKEGRYFETNVSSTSKEIK